MGGATTFGPVNRSSQPIGRTQNWVDMQFSVGDLVLGSTGSVFCTCCEGLKCSDSTARSGVRHLELTHGRRISGFPSTDYH